MPAIPEAAKVEETVPATLQVAAAVAPSPILIEDTQETQAATPSLLRAHAATRLDSLEDDLNALLDQAPATPDLAVASLPTRDPPKDAASRTFSTLAHASSFEDQSLVARVVKAPSCPNDRSHHIVVPSFLLVYNHLASACPLQELVPPDTSASHHHKRLQRLEAAPAPARSKAKARLRIFG